jgi:hypothetical protein
LAFGAKRHAAEGPIRRRAAEVTGFFWAAVVLFALLVVFLVGRQSVHDVPVRCDECHPAEAGRPIDG